ncbi:MAG: hypothetical protein JJ892_14200 [Balneola sp.]|nr:hypothetical protein [Balneola sp.]MBO6649861.1 hypothetical protein [Balneola sp.]MBO6712425.1 hypothetical protein [Balneola sp.]MBO6801424.1 hypothetical protein [Balneola sp.]MBO6871762.1 hypothetical protein [Balneola sp.]
MRLSLFILSLFLILAQSPNLKAQNNFFSGEWVTYTNEFHTWGDKNFNGNININSLGEARWIHSERLFLSRLKTQYSGCVPAEKSISNYSSFTLSLAIECADSDTVYTFNLTGFSVGNPFYVLAATTHIKSLKNNSNVDVKCFLGGGCNMNSFNSYLRRPSNRTIMEDFLFIGSATNPDITIEEIRFTDEALEVLLLFNKIDQEYSGNLHSPGTDFALYVRDSSGNRYDLISQFGWMGSDKHGFGNMVIPADTEQHLLLFFEPATNSDSITNLSLIEGSCETGCWNFYDVRLKDKK